MAHKKNLIDLLKRQMEQSTVDRKYSVTSKGIFFGKNLLSRSIIAVTELLQDADTSEVYIEVAFSSLINGVHNKAFKRSELLGNNIISDLVALGFDAQPSGEASLKELLASLIPDGKPKTLVKKTGWHSIGDKLVYVYGDKLITEEGSKAAFAIELDKKSNISVKGKFEDWKKNIADKVKGHFIMEGALGFSFAAPFIKFMPSTHCFAAVFHGKSSSGKTTTLQVAASVFGYAGEGSGSRIQSLRTTTNGLENLFSSCNDSICTLDELRTLGNVSLSQSMYMLSDSEGKARAKSDGSQQEKNKWETIALLSGEISGKEFMSKEASNAGSHVRCLDIDVENSVVRLTNSKDPSHAEFAENIKKSVSNYYGTAGAKYLQYIVNNYTESELSERLEDLHGYYVDLLTEKIKNQPDEVVRMLKNLSLAAVGLEMANEAGVLNHASEEEGGINYYPEIEDILFKLADRVLKNTQTISDADKGVINLKGFLCEDKIFGDKSNTYGFLTNVRGGKLYCIHTHKLTAISKYSERQVAQRLNNLELLHHNNGKRLKSRLKNPSGETVTVYAIKPKIFQLDDNLTFIKDEPIVLSRRERRK